MFDIALRSYKDLLFEPISHSVPGPFTPLRITAVGFTCGLFACFFACADYRSLSLVFWILNRSLDCLDGAVARHRKQQSDLGGFFDLLADFVIFALIPICCCLQHAFNILEAHRHVPELLLVALLEAAFFINNFILFYIAALVEKSKAEGAQRRADEVTSLVMRPALIEGFESGVFFTLMLAMPSMIGPLALVMFLGVVIGTSQRVRWLTTLLSRMDQKAS